MWSSLREATMAPSSVIHNTSTRTSESPHSSPESNKLRATTW